MLSTLQANWVWPSSLVNPSDGQGTQQQQQNFLPAPLSLCLKLDLVSTAAEASNRGLVSGGNPWQTVKAPETEVSSLRI